MASLFDAAYDAAETEEQREHVEAASVHAHFLGLSATYETNGTTAAYRERYAWLWNYYKNNAANTSNPNGIKGTVFGSGIANFDKFPGSASDVYSPMDWIFRDGFDGHSGVFIFPFGLPN